MDNRSNSNILLLVFIVKCLTRNYLCRPKKNIKVSTACNFCSHLNYPTADSCDFTLLLVVLKRHRLPSDFPEFTNVYPICYKNVCHYVTFHIPG